ncbi:Retrotransposon gag protein [Corchorus capsularis]|uniref:Retrotransposon gag protein n=1 Tax=Corchorus capsularis TaxID=210143 RepID=A0A1R3JCA8_COCAP|nr:Retrotransposon gag protein [Corchorus capsularis]
MTCYFKWVEKLGLKTIPHPTPYKLSWLKDESDLKVTYKCQVAFSIGKYYSDEVECDVVPMDACHLLLGSPWLYDRHVIYDGHGHSYTLKKDGRKITLTPLKPKATLTPKVENLLMSSRGLVPYVHGGTSNFFQPGENDTGVSHMSHEADSGEEDEFSKASTTPCKHIALMTCHFKWDQGSHVGWKLAPLQVDAYVEASISHFMTHVNDPPFSIALVVREIIMSQQSVDGGRVAGLDTIEGLRALVESLQNRLHIVEERQRHREPSEGSSHTRRGVRGDGTSSSSSERLHPDDVGAYLRRQQQQQRGNNRHEEVGDNNKQIQQVRDAQANYLNTFVPKVQIPEFDGRGQPDDFLEWLHTVERIFEYQDVPENKQVKLVAIKLRKHASLWWENLRMQRERNGKEKIRTWDKMVREFKKKFLPEDYKQDVFLKLQNLKQGSMNVLDYTAEFDALMIKANINEPEEQTIARYLAGLKISIANIVVLQPYRTLNDVIKLALRVEKQVRNKSVAKLDEKEPSEETTPKAPFVPKCNIDVNNKDKGKRATDDSGKQRSDDDNEKNELEAEQAHEEEVLVHADQGESFLVQRVFNITQASPGEDWKRKNVFHTRCTCQGKICMVIIDSGSFENHASTEMVQKLGLKTIPHPTPYKLSWLKDESDLKVTYKCQVAFSIGKYYSDEVECDVVPMDACHLLLGSPWLYDRHVIYDGHGDTYTLKKDGRKITLTPLKPKATPTPKVEHLLMSSRGLVPYVHGGTSNFFQPGENDTGVSHMRSCMPKTRSSGIEGLECNPEPERTLFQKKKKTQSRLEEEESSNSSSQPSSPRSAVSTSSEDMAEEEQPKTLRELAAPNVNAKREDPHRYLTDFQIACSSTSIQGIPEDQFLLRTFPFTLMDRAKDWLYLLPTSSITSWTSLKKLFLEKYFPAHNASSIRKEICGIKQRHGETMHQYWERFKTLCASCPNHQINEQLLIQYFYEGLLPFHRSSIDSASGGAFIDKTPAEAWTLVENMAANTQQFGSREDFSREGPTRRINEVSTYSTSLEQQLQETNQQIAILTNLSQANFSSLPRVCAIEMQQIKEAMEMMRKQICQLASDLSDLKTQGQQRIPSQPKVPPRENVSAISLRTGKELKDPYPTLAAHQQDKGESSYTKEDLQLPAEIKIEDEHNDKRAAPIEGSNKEEAATQPKGKVEVNIPLLDAIQQIPNYAKFLKQLCTNKKRLQSKVSAGTNVSAVLQKSLPPKCKDPGTFSITCSIGRSIIENAMLDLGASLTVMPYSFYKSLNLGFLKNTDVILQLANGSLVYPKGRPFLKISHTKIDVFNGSLTMEFDGEVIHPRISSQVPLKSNNFVYVISSKFVKKGAIEDSSSTSPAQISKGRQRIAAFKQQKDENFYQAWDRFKMLCANCPDHGISQQLLISYFYEGLGVDDQILVESIDNIPLFDRTPDAA